MNCCLVLGFGEMGMEVQWMMDCVGCLSSGFWLGMSDAVVYVGLAVSDCLRPWFFFLILGNSVFMLKCFFW